MNIFWGTLQGLYKKSIPLKFKLSATKKGDFGLIGQFFLRLLLINFTSGSGRLEKADKDFKNIVIDALLTETMDECELRYEGLYTQYCQH